MMLPLYFLFAWVKDSTLFEIQEKGSIFISSKPQFPLLSSSSVASQTLKTLLLKTPHTLEGELEDGTDLGLFHWRLAQMVAEGVIQAVQKEKSSSAMTATKPNDQNDKVPPKV